MQFFCNEFVIANEDVCQYLGVIIIANLTSRPLLTMPNQESLKALVYLVDYIIYSLYPLYSVIFQFNSTPSLITDFYFRKALFPPTSPICSASTTTLPVYELYLIPTTQPL